MTQREFYHSAAWTRLARTFLCSKHYICARCGRSAEIAHHVRYLNDSNVNDPSISMNPDNLLALCQACHNAEHFGKGGAIAAGYRFNADGEIIPTSNKEEHHYDV